MTATEEAYTRGADWAICMVLILDANDLLALKAKIKAGHNPSETLQALMSTPAK